MTGEPLFQRFAEQIKREIKAGTYPIGCILPSISKLQKSSGLSRNTIVAAIDVLQKELVIERAGAARYGYRVLNAGITTNTISNKKTNQYTIAIIFPFSYNNYIGGKLLEAMEAVLSDHSCTLIIRNHGNSLVTEREILNYFLEKDLSSLDGIIYIPASTYSNSNIDVLNRIIEKIPVITVDRYVYNFPTSFVGLNNREIGINAVSYLLKHGHTRLGFFSGFEQISSIAERLAGFIEACDRYSLHLNKKHILHLEEISVLNPSSNTLNKLERFFDFAEDFPTAIFCGDDKSAMMIYRFLNMRGFKIPEDISIIGCDDDGFVHAASNYTITSFKHPFTIMAEEAYRIFILETNYRNRPNTHIELSAQLVDRSSVKTME